MKRQRHGKQVLAVLLAFCLFLPAVFSTPAAVPAADTGLNSQMTPEEQQSYLEMKLRQTEKTLETLGKQSKDTQAYLDALDQKIGYLRSQLKLTEQKVDTAENRITVLQKQQKKNRQDQAALQQQITDTKQQITVLDAQFQQNYQRYCQRLRAMYISGETNVLAFLLGSTDIGQLLTRYEAKTDLTARQKDLQTKKTALAASQTELEQTVTTLQADQKDLTTRRQVLTDQQTEANRLLKQLTDKTKAYTEYRNVTQNDLDEIDRQIAEAAKKYTTTTTTTTTTTKKHTTTESKRLHLTYPVPSQTRITTAFHGYAGHSGCDFACASGSRVVAAESGTVIVSADLTNSDGSYRSYGRYIVIAHDKTDSVGNSVYTLYAHNSRRVVSAGTHVHRGQLIAYSGSTGNSTGPHCHFEVRTPTASYNDCVNPEIYLP